MLLRWLTFPVLVWLPVSLMAQNFTSFFTGDTTDVISSHRPGILLAGGGGDQDEAMRWFLQGAAGGDVLVLRASGADGYNDYLFSELGVAVNSVETIRFADASAAYDPYVLQQIERAEALFLAGGDQRDYYDYWKNTPVEEAINALIQDKKITVGGTSAGMAVLGQHYYVPTDLGVTSSEALADPFHPYTHEIGTDSFLLAPFLQNTITDTHYDQRNRHGRHIVFLARTAAATGERTYGIACNEYVATAIDENGQARVFGSYPAYDDYAYFLQVNCQEAFQAENLQPTQALHWVRDSMAVQVYRAPGRPDGSTVFDLSTWNSGIGGEWQHWYVEQGVLREEAGTAPGCNLLSTLDVYQTSELELYPNPASSQLFLGNAPPGIRMLQNVYGQILHQWPATQHHLQLPTLPKGWYIIQIPAADGKVWTGRFYKTN